MCHKCNKLMWPKVKNLSEKVDTLDFTTYRCYSCGGEQSVEDREQDRLGIRTSTG